MTISPVGAEFLNADRRTDMTKLIVAFHNSANAPQNVSKRVSISFPFVITHCNSAALISVLAGMQKRFATMNHKLKTEQPHNC